MTTPIRTPEDEVTKPGWFYPPFTEGWYYQGATYPGHSDFSVDFNRRTASGGWMNDAGDPVLAAADGTVAEVDPAEGLVMLSHAGGYRTEYRHMEPVSVKKGQRVQRSDKLGGIGDAGNAPNGTHLHHVHYRTGKRIQMRFEGKPVDQSVAGSDSKGDDWTPPAPELYVGPPPKATWESAYREAARLLARKDTTIVAKQSRIDALTTDLNAANAALAACQASGGDCTAEAEAARLAGMAEGITEGRAGFEAEALVLLGGLVA